MILDNGAGLRSDLPQDSSSDFLSDFRSNFRSDFRSGMRPARIEIDLGALANNAREARRLAGDRARVCAVVKADGYGHGAPAIADVLLKNGANSLAVATIDEGLELRGSGILAPLLVLGPCEPDTDRLVLAIENGLSLTAHSKEAAQAISRAQKSARADLASAWDADGLAKTHIKLDTGMGRIGIEVAADSRLFDGEGALFDIKEKRADALAERFAQDAADLTAKIAEAPGIRVAGVYTHFAVADEATDESRAYTDVQLRLFKKSLSAIDSRGVKYGVAHCANSAAAICRQDAHFDMIRPGIMLYGSFGSASAAAAMRDSGVSLLPVMSLRSRIAHMKTIQPGLCVSYGRKFTAARATRVATLPLGYADGLPRKLSNGVGGALINGRLAPIIGMICMDMTMVDATDIGDARPGDEAVLLGRQGDLAITADDIAEKTGTISYEILCQLNSKRVPRLYINTA